MSNHNYELISLALSERRRIRAKYYGHMREMCPHAIGSNKGKDRALFWQFGSSSREKPFTPGWKCMDIYLLRDVEIVEGDWQSPPDPLKNSAAHRKKCVGIIDLEVEI
jgi:hypothetical protein